MSNGDYVTIRGFAEKSFTEKKSEFIGYIKPVSDNDEAVEFINEIRIKHRKATHNVYAYITRKDSVSRYSDDGEPQGTAGVPVLDVLRKEGLTDICCVVTRYFGGILLGGGGLVRAYSHSAALAVEAAEIMIMCRCYPVTVRLSYELYGRISYILPEFEVKQKEPVFGEDVTLSFYVKEKLCDALLKKITDSSSGKANITAGELTYENFA